MWIFCSTCCYTHKKSLVEHCWEFTQSIPNYDVVSYYLQFTSQIVCIMPFVLLYPTPCVPTLNLLVWFQISFNIFTFSNRLGQSYSDTSEVSTPSKRKRESSMGLSRSKKSKRWSKKSKRWSKKSKRWSKKSKRWSNNTLKQNIQELISYCLRTWILGRRTILSRFFEGACAHFPANIDPAMFTCI